MTGDEIKKAQLIWLCWMLLQVGMGNRSVRARIGIEAVPSGFVTRLRKLLEQGVGAPERPGRAGVNIMFDRLQAWEVAIGLLLSNLGLPQGHVGFCIGHMRVALGRAYDRICASLPSLRGKLSAKDRPKAPTRMGEPALADTDCFLLLRPVEIREALSGQGTSRIGELDQPPRQPQILFDPAQDIVFGGEALAKRLALRSTTAPLGRSSGEQGWIVLEISVLVSQINALWDQVPEIRRGRPT